MTNKEYVKQTRKGLFHNCTSCRTVPKGDRRVKSTRICSACSRMITSYSQDGPTVLIPHYRLDLGSFLQFSLCKDIRSCYRNISIKEGE